MPSHVTGMDTIFFIPKDKVLQAWAKDATYGLITCLIRLENTNELNQTRLVAGGDSVHYPFARRHTNHQLTYHQATHQQRDLHTWGKILHNGHQEFVPMYSHDKVWVHAIKTLRHARQRHPTPPPVQHRNTRRVRLLQNLPRNVWAPTSRDHHAGTVGKKTEGIRLHPEQNNTWAVDTWVAPNHFFSCCRQLWGKIHQRWTCPAPPTNGEEILYMLVQKWGGKTLQTHHQVGLYWQERAPFNAIIHQEGIKLLSASSTYCTAGSTASACQKVIWWKSLTSKPTWHLPAHW